MFVECETQGNILKVKYLGIRILQFTSNLSFYQRSQASGSLQQYSWDPSIRSACTILANLIIAISPVLSNIFRCGKKHLVHITRLQYDQHLITYFSKQLLIFRKPLNSGLFWTSIQDARIPNLCHRGVHRPHIIEMYYVQCRIMYNVLIRL